MVVQRVEPDTVDLGGLEFIQRLDEPFNGLDKDAMEEMRGLFQQLKTKGKLIILVSHYAQEIADNCDIVYEIVGGALRLVDKAPLKAVSNV